MWGPDAADKGRRNKDEDIENENGKVVIYLSLSNMVKPSTNNMKGWMNRKDQAL